LKKQDLEIKDVSQCHILKESEDTWLITDLRNIPVTYDPLDYVPQRRSGSGKVIFDKSKLPNQKRRKN